jgi:hypothetical protein
VDVVVVQTREHGTAASVDHLLVREAAQLFADLHDDAVSQAQVAYADVAQLGSGDEHAPSSLLVQAYSLSIVRARHDTVARWSGRRARW